MVPIALSPPPSRLLLPLYFALRTSLHSLVEQEGERNIYWSLSLKTIQNSFVLTPPPKEMLFFVYMCVWLLLLSSSLLLLLR